MRYAVLFGPPNAGKTSLFNSLTGSQKKVVNYPGSTVDISSSLLKDHPSLTLIDTPGIQGFIPNSDDEALAIQSITQLNTLIKEAPQAPDLILYALDVTQHERHLAILKRLIEDGYAVIVAITMMDRAEKLGIQIDEQELAQQLGVSVFKLVGQKKDWLPALRQGIIINSVPCGRLIKKKAFGLKDIVHAHQWAKRISKRCFSQKKHPQQSRIDRILLHPIWGYGVFLGIMSTLFYLSFYFTSPLVDAIDGSFAWLIEKMVTAFPHNALIDFIANGLLAGMAGILVFVPPIAALVFSLGLLENSGYLARSAALIDKPLSYIGLNGRSFLPLLSGCACAIPAVLATRTIANPWVRKLTILVIPLMQCAARLPVYGLLLSILFSSAFIKAAALTGIYFFSFILSAAIAAIAHFCSKNKNKHDHFIMELPALSKPSLAIIGQNVVRQCKNFIKGAGPLILLFSVILWFIANYPSPDASFLYSLGQWIEPIFKPMGLDWRVGVAIILSFAAREVFVAALLLVLNIGSEGVQSIAEISAITFENSNQALFTPGSTLGLILFFMVAMQCAATVATIHKETGSFKIPGVQLVTYIVLAYALAVSSNFLYGHFYS